MNSFKETIEKIKKRGYWRIVISPVFQINPFFGHIVEAKSFVDEHKIQLRGWDYPHLPTSDDYEGIELLPDRANAFIDWNHFKECWTYFQSGQFVHVFGLREDWFDESDWFDENHPFKKTEPLSVLDFVWTTLSLTEIFIFSKGIASDERYKGQIKLQVSFHNVCKRSLTVFDRGRIPIFFKRVSLAPEIVVIDKKLTTEDLAQNYLQLAKDAAVCVFKYFDWPDPPIKVIEGDQQRLINRTL